MRCIYRKYCELSKMFKKHISAEYEEKCLKKCFLCNSYKEWNNKYRKLTD